MLRPTAEQLHLLTPTERACFAVADTVNRRPAVKRAAHTFLRTVGREWVRLFTDKLLHVEGIDRLRALDPDRGVFLISNHRSFFDFYVASSLILRNTSWVERMYFPVRSTFFYEGVAGNLVNMVMSAWAMYPPVLRDPDRRAFNQYTVGFLKEELQRRGTFPRRLPPRGLARKGPDPYALLRRTSARGPSPTPRGPSSCRCSPSGSSTTCGRSRRRLRRLEGAGRRRLRRAPRPRRLLRDARRARDATARSPTAWNALIGARPRERAFRAAEGLPPMGPASASAASGEGGEGDDARPLTRAPPEETRAAPHPPPSSPEVTGTRTRPSTVSARRSVAVCPPTSVAVATR
ncbi:MAG: hypothetical protein R3A52_18045 [Polyangiales bacterium]